ncbi:MAG: hypothetical protein LBB77_07120 [Treponema sp.]|jgi:hypothetical protein|nr:hypothetical protein [Treponema sp.]
MKRFLTFLAVLFVFSAGERAEGLDLDFTWGLGEMEAYYSGAVNFIDGRLSLGHFDLLVNKKLGLGLQIFNLGSIGGNETISYTFLPLKAEYRLFNPGGMFYIGLYGKAAWQFTKSQKETFNPFTPAPDSGFYGGAGLEFALPLPLFKHYEGVIALFVEYGVPEKFKAGFRVDLLSLGALFFSTVP